MYFNTFSHLFVIHIIIKSQGLIGFLSVCVQGTIQKKLPSSSPMLPLVIFDKKALFSKNSVTLRYFWVKVPKVPKVPFCKDSGCCLKILDYTPMCVCMGRILKNVYKTYEGGRDLLETYESIQGGRGSKIAKFEWNYFLNDP